MTPSGKRIVRLSLRVLLTGSVLACAACSGLSQQTRDAIGGADEDFRQGRYTAALRTYEATVEEAREYGDESAGRIDVRIGRCELSLGRPEKAISHLAGVQGRNADLPPELVSELYLGLGDAECELGRRREPVFVGSSPEERLRSREDAAAAQKNYRRALNYYVDAKDAAAPGSREAYESKLGAGYCFLRRGILSEGGSSDLRTAEGAFRELRSDAERFNDPRHSLYLAVTSFAQTKILNDDIYTRFLQSRRLDPDKALHELYRELVVMLADDYAAPPKVRSLDETSRLRIEDMIAWLRDYKKTGSSADSPQWVESRAKAIEYVDGYDDWLTKESRAKSLIASADKLPSTESSSSLEIYQEAVRRLDGVDGAFRNDDYLVVRRGVQKSLILSLQEAAQNLIQVEDWDEAKSRLLEAEGLCDRSVLPVECDTLKLECRRLRDVAVKGEQFALKEAQIRQSIEAGDQDVARRALAEVRRDSRFTGDLYAGGIASLQKELDSAAAVIDVSNRLRRIRSEAQTLPHEDILELAGNALKIAEDNNLEHYEAEARRAKAEAHCALEDYGLCLTTLEKIDTPEPADRALRGLCHYKLGAAPDAVKQFRNLRPEYIKNAAFKDAALEAAGRSFLKEREFREARLYLDEVADRQGVREARLETYRGLLGELQLAEEPNGPEVIRLCAQISELDPSDHASRLQTALILLKSAEATRDEETYRQAFDQFLAYNEVPDAPELKRDVRQNFAELSACFADYLPLRANAEWVYRVNGKATVTYRVIFVGQGGKFQVQTPTAGDDQIWEVNDRYRKFSRSTKEDVLLEELPVGKQPFTDKPKFNFKAEDTSYIAALKEIGQEVTVEAGTFYDCIVVKVGIRGENESSHVEYVLAPGIGIIRIRDPRTEENIELISTSYLPT